MTTPSLPPVEPSVAPSMAAAETPRARLVRRLLLAILIPLAIATLYGVVLRPLVRKLGPRGRAAARIQPYAAKLASEHVTLDPAQKPYVTGKVVVVDAERAEVDPSFHELPAELVPNDAGGIGTVVRATCGVGQNLADSTCWYDCRLVVVDWSRRTQVGAGHVRSDPTILLRGRRGSTGCLAQRPNEKLADFVAALPRR